MFNFFFNNTWFLFGYIYRQVIFTNVYYLERLEKIAYGCEITKVSLNLKLYQTLNIWYNGKNAKSIKVAFYKYKLGYIYIQIHIRLNSSCRFKNKTYFVYITEIKYT